MKIVLLEGLPASGKSTIAINEYVKNGYFRVNRDSLRAMLFPNTSWSGRKEGLVIKAECQLVKTLLSEGVSVVVDDCNLGEKNINMWKNIAAECGAEAVHRYIDTPVDVCIACDSAREVGKGYVGSSVINRMALKNGLLKFNREIVLCDIDGTLSSCEHRLKYVLNCKHCGFAISHHPILITGDRPQHNTVTRKLELNSTIHCSNPAKNWDAFFDRVYEDEPRIGTILWVRELAKYYDIVILSGRPEKTNKDTEDWLSKWNVPHNCLIMRQSHDRRDDTIVKKEMLDLLPKDQILWAIDDRKSVIDMWKANGIKVYDVGPKEGF